MNAARMRNAYKHSEAQSQIHPVKLIHKMYERILAHLGEAEKGVVRKDPRVRGENLGKAIALITELNASIKEDDSSEAAIFLRGLYGAILTELPKVSITGDTGIIKQTSKYLMRLKEIWEQTAMRENGFGVEQSFEKFTDGPVNKRHVPDDDGEPSEMVEVPRGLSVSI